MKADFQIGTYLLPTFLPPIASVLINITQHRFRNKAEDTGDLGLQIPFPLHALVLLPLSLCMLFPITALVILLH